MSVQYDLEAEQASPRPANQTTPNLTLVGDDRSPSARTKGTSGKIRAMQVEDIPSVGELFYLAFRHQDRASPPDLNAYLKSAFFDCPFYDEAHGSLIHTDRDGRVDAALLALPMRFMACDRVVTGRLMSAYMADPNSRSGGAAKLALTLRPRSQEFCFSDTASETSADHIHAMGGMVLPIESLEWRRIFRPARHAVQALERRKPVLARLGLGAIAAPFDAGLRAITPARTHMVDGHRVTSLSDADFIELAPRLIAHFAVRPIWTPAEMTWLLHMARQQVQVGQLQLRGVYGLSGQIVGAYVYYGGPGMPAQVLNILSQPGRERDIVSAMLADLEASGATSAAGMAQPFLVDAFEGRAGVTYRHRSYFWVSTKHAEVRDAVRAGDFYAGGLASEAWSRLLADFN